MKKLTLIILLICTACSSTKQTVEHLPQTPNETLSLIVATDLHYFDSSLYTQGPLFDSIIANGDGKVTHYSDQVLDAFIQEVIEVHPDFLILTGDLTFNGEKVSHQALADKLSEVEAAGIYTYVMPGNHDVNNPRARGYGETEHYRTDSISSKEFASIYEAYGYKPGESIKDPDSLSYLIKLNDTNWMFMLDSNNNTKPGRNATEISGSIAKETMDWMERVLETNEDDNLNIMVAMHHNLYKHSDMINDGFTIDNPTTFTEFLSKHNINIIFSGHIHIQSIVQDKETNISEIATDSLSVSPNQYGYVLIENNKLTYESKPLNFNMKNGADFQTISQEYFLEIAYTMVTKRFEESTLSESDIHDIAQVFSELNQYYFAGQVVDDIDAYKEHNGYKIIKENGFFLDYLDAILNNTLNSNYVEIDLN